MYLHLHAWTSYQWSTSPWIKSWPIIESYPHCAGCVVASSCAWVTKRSGMISHARKTVSMALILIEVLIYWIASLHALYELNTTGQGSVWRVRERLLLDCMNYLIVKHKLNHPLSFDKDWDIICYKCSLNCSRSSLIIKLILLYLPTHWCSMPGRVVCFVCCCTGGYYTFVCKMTFMPDFLIVFALYGHTVPTLH